MEQTPPMRVVRPRHTPTPKMSERKKNLFTVSKSKNMPTTIDEDSDLGPMSPLQFSCSPSSHDAASHHGRFMKHRESRTDFKNIMLQLSPISTNKQVERTQITPTKRNVQSKASTSSAMYERVQDSPQSSSKSSDMFGGEKENRIESAQKTPSPADIVPSAKEFPRISFRKSLIFDTGLTPSESSYPSANSKKSQHIKDDDDAVATTTSDNPKARASLTFNEQPQISVKSFYGSSIVKTTPLRRSVPSNFTAVQSKSTVKRRVKTTSRAARSSGPTLGNRGVHHKITMPKPQTSVAPAPPKTSQPTTSRTTRLIEAAIENLETKQRLANHNTSRAGSSSSSSSTKQHHNHHDDDQAITQAQLDKLKKILQNQRNPSELSAKPLKWTGSQPNLNAASSSATDLNNTTFGQSSSFLDNSAMNASAVSTASSCPETEADDDEPLTEEPKRKFFKSKAPSSANSYTVIKGVCATVKRGSGVTLLEQPKSKKIKRNEEYYELKALKEDVSNIIDMLVNSDDDATSPPFKHAAQHQASTLGVQPLSVPLMTTDDHSANQPNPMQDGDVQFPHDGATGEHGATEIGDLSSFLNYQRFSEMLPYNTDDPDVQQRQETLLNLLFTNNICTEQNFKIFIAEPSQHEAEAARILEELFVLDVQEPNEMEPMEPEDVPMDVVEPAAVDVSLSPTSQINTMTLSLALSSPTTGGGRSSEMHIETGADDVGAAGNPTKKVYPVFERNHAAKIGAATRPPMADQLREENRNAKHAKWKPIDDKQLQIDAGQKRFGGTLCSCGMFYSVHVPEDEELHTKYHDIYNQLQFKGWAEERVVCSVPEWGNGARIICVTDLDTKMKRNRCGEFVALVDRELGYADIPTKPQSIIYLAINKRQVIGVCVAEPLHEAHPLRVENGIEMMDLTKKCAVKCGISRLWVAGPHRRHGIAMRMFSALRSHFIRGYTLRLTEVAFSAPTELGRAFAGRVMANKVLVY